MFAHEACTNACFLPRKNCWKPPQTSTAQPHQLMREEVVRLTRHSDLEGRPLPASEEAGHHRGVRSNHPTPASWKLTNWWTSHVFSQSNNGGHEMQGDLLHDTLKEGNGLTTRWEFQSSTACQETITLYLVGGESAGSDKCRAQRPLGRHRRTLTGAWQKGVAHTLTQHG